VGEEGEEETGGGANLAVLRVRARVKPRVEHAFVRIVQSARIAHT